MLQIAAMNMMMHNIENPNISSRNGLTAPEEGQENEHDKYSVVLANPPFTGSIEKDTIAPELTAVASTIKTELLFIAQFLKLLKVGGRAAVIVPNGVLFSSSKAHVAIRKELIGKKIMFAYIEHVNIDIQRVLAAFLLLLIWLDDRIYCGSHWNHKFY